jgi:hypothetical protein
MLKHGALSYGCGGGGKAGAKGRGKGGGGGSNLTVLQVYSNKTRIDIEYMNTNKVVGIPESLLAVRVVSR